MSGLRSVTISFGQSLILEAGGNCANSVLGRPKIVGLGESLWSANADADTDAEMKPAMSGIFMCSGYAALAHFFHENLNCPQESPLSAFHFFFPRKEATRS